MSLLDSLKDIFNITPVDIGELNRRSINMNNNSDYPASDPLEGVEITDEYQMVKSLIEDGYPIVFVSGKAGTGKTTMIQYLRQVLNENIVVVAPTGVAALNVKGVTIHSFFHFPPRIIVDEDINIIRPRQLYEHLDVLIIDEVSMVRADILDAIDKFLRKNRRQLYQPFGGVQLLLVGDLFQLPPIITRSEEQFYSCNYPSPFFFSAKALQNCQLIPIELTKIFRQVDPVFTDTLNKIRVAEQLDTILPQINQVCYADTKVTDPLLTLTCTNDSADQKNIAELEKLPGRSRIFQGVASGKFSIENEKLPSPFYLTLKVGAQVMFTKNDDSKRWVNGSLGRVVDFDDSSIQVQLLSDNPGRTYGVHRVNWETYRYEYDVVLNKIKPVIAGSYTQFPLMLSWAVTIHKSQGKTLKNVLIDLGHGAFAPGQVYVALSRCRSMDDISLVRPIERHEVKCDETVKRFYLAMTELMKDIE